MEILDFVATVVLVTASGALAPGPLRARTVEISPASCHFLKISKTEIEMWILNS